MTEHSYPNCTPLTLCQVCVERLKAERDRYKAALENIAQVPCCEACHGPCAGDRATAALNPKSEKPS